MLEGRSYVPLLHARLAEMRALRELPTATKNLIFPVIRIRPWLNSRALNNVFEVIEAGVGNRMFGLDLDPSRNLPEKAAPAYQEFRRLFLPDGAFSAYYDCVAQAPNRVPVLRTEQGALQLQGQLDRVEFLDRGLVVRVMVEAPANFRDIAGACLERGIENVVFVFDCGWRPDVLVQAARCTALVDSLMDISEDFEVVVAGSSFPEAFSGLGARFLIDVGERFLFQQVRRNINRGILFYGDWGSTRRPTDPVPMTNVPRIDMAHRFDWTCWRSEDGEDYAGVAARVVGDPDWDGNLGVWGEYMIESTAEGLDPAIRSPAMAAAVRVNLHMNVQANFDNPEVEIVDEPVGEDL